MFNVNVSLTPESLAALNGLAEALRLSAGTAAPLNGLAASSTTAGPIYWADESTGDFGEVDSEAAYAAKKSKYPKAYKITEGMYRAKVDALREKNAAAAKAKADKEQAAADAKAKKTTDAADTKAKKAAEAEAEKPAAETGAAELSPVTKDEMLAAVRGYLSPEITDKAERDLRTRFVKALLARFGASKASELSEEFYALTKHLIERKTAGEDIDPERADFAEAAPYFAKEEDDLV